MLLYEYLHSCKGITCIKKEALKATFKDIRSYHKFKKPENLNIILYHIIHLNITRDIELV